MTKLTGSEKQIAWAEKIFNEKLKKLNEWKSYIATKTTKKAEEEMQEIKKDFIFLKKISQASFLIKYKDYDFRFMRNEIETDPYKDSPSLSIKY